MHVRESCMGPEFDGRTGLDPASCCMSGSLAWGQNLTGAQPGPGCRPKFDIPLFDGRPEPRPKFDVLTPPDAKVKAKKLIRLL